MKHRWVVITNSNHCLIYQFDSENRCFHQIQEYHKPDTGLKSSELVTDRPGRYNGPALGARSGYEKSDPEEVTIDNFLRTLAHELDESRKQHLFEELIFIMPDHILGQVQQHLNKNVKAMVKKTIHKNMMQLPEQALLSYLKKHHLH